jgi:hypothetical protein
MENTHCVIYSAASAEQAHLLANLLNDEGIYAYVTNQSLRIAGGDLPFGTATAPQVVVHQDDADEARQLAVEFDHMTRSSCKPGPPRWQFSLAAILYAIFWIAIFLGINRVIVDDPSKQIANLATFTAMVLATFVIVAWKVALRNRAYPSDELPGQWKGAPMVKEASEDESPDAWADEPAWPECPHCHRPRMTSCPSCGTAGSDFTPAFVPQLIVEGDEELEKEPADSQPLSVLCPTCDEPFAPRFPAQCEWCGHRFRDGYAPPLLAPEVTSPFTDMNERVWIVIGGLVAFLAAVAWFFSEFVLKR